MLQEKRVFGVFGVVLTDSDRLVQKHGVSLGVSHAKTGEVTFWSKINQKTPFLTIFLVEKSTFGVKITFGHFLAFFAIFRHFWSFLTSGGVFRGGVVLAGGGLVIWVGGWGVGVGGSRGSSGEKCVPRNPEKWAGF